jgi:hypothetical protein
LKATRSSKLRQEHPACQRERFDRAPMKSARSHPRPVFVFVRIQSAGHRCHDDMDRGPRRLTPQLVPEEQDAASRDRSERQCAGVRVWTRKAFIGASDPEKRPARRREHAAAAAAVRCLHRALHQERPHAALGMKVHAELYTPSPRVYRGLADTGVPVSRRRHHGDALRPDLFSGMEREPESPVCWTERRRHAGR